MRSDWSDLWAASRLAMNIRHCLFLVKKRRWVIFSLLVAFTISCKWILNRVSFVELQNMDLVGGEDFECFGSLVKGKCEFVVNRLHYEREGKLWCILLGLQCKGFVHNMGSNILTLKASAEGQLAFSPGITFFVKKAYSTNLEIKYEECAAELQTKDSESVQHSTSSSREETACSLPDPNPFDPSILKLITDKGELKCKGNSLTELVDGKLRIVDQASPVKVTKVEYKTVKRKPKDDYSFSYGKSGTLTSKEREVELNEEFVQVKVHTEDGAVQKDFHLEVQPKKRVLANAKSNSRTKPGIPLNIFMIGFDSTSRSMFTRKMPKVHRYLVDDPSSFILKGYSVVGDGTPPAQIAILVGKAPEELPEARPSAGVKAKCVDRWNFIYSSLKQHGYATLYSEDQPSYGTFWYRYIGFCNQPTDHYTRPFFLSHLKETKDQGIWCLGSQPAFRRRFNYLKSYYKAYPDILKFSFSFLCLGHEDFNELGYAESDILDLIQHLRDNGHLNNTVLVLFGDHGTRWGDIRSTLIGELEERLPFISITLPLWFERKYPNLVKNLKVNTKRLTTPFDVHATLKHLLSYPQRPITDRGRSLFDEIELSRTCETAGIPEHFCTCLNWKPVDTRHKHIARSAHAAVEYINRLVGEEKLYHKCEKLDLKMVRSAVRVEPNKDVKKYSHDKKSGSCDYQLQIQTTPNNGLYEVTAHILNGNVNIDPSISRLDKYGDQPRCIMDQFPHLRKFCYCKKQ